MISLLFARNVRRRKRYISLAVHAWLVGLLLLLIPAGAIARPLITINQINIEKFPSIRIYLTASDARGRPLKGLTVSNFSVQEDGEAIRVGGVFPLEKGNDPLSVVLVIDRSGSMKGQPIRDALQAAQDFIKEMRGIDQVGIISFDDTVTTVIPLSSDKEALSQAIVTIVVGKDTALNDAIMRALEMLSPITGRRTVVVLTDGKENRSTASREKIVQEAIRIGVPVITIGLGEEVDEYALRHIAQNTGGRSFFTRKSGELSGLYRLIARQLINQYRVTLESKNSLDGGWHKLQITIVTKGGKAEVERLYLATLKQTVTTAPLKEYRKQSEWLYMVFIGLVALIAILVMAIIVTLTMRYK